MFADKYRPRQLSDFGFSTAMHELIESFLQSDRIAILFVGDQGSGKTSLLNVIVQNYYSPYRYGQYNHNILFINNLKDQGFSFFRNEIKTFCQSRSLFHDRKKMIVLDDIDLINKQNQHVFRNYVDKYGHQVHFLLVCSNLQRVIDSLQSRMYILKLPVANMEFRRGVLENICSRENIRLTEDAKQYVLRLSDNIAGSSIRNIVNFLEKIWLLYCPSQSTAASTAKPLIEKNLETSTPPMPVPGPEQSTAKSLIEKNLESQQNPVSPELDMDMCKIICSAIPLERFDEYLEYVLTQDLANGVKVLLDIYEYGFSVIDILDYFFTFVKCNARLKDEQKYRTIIVLCDYISVYHNVHEHPIELALFTSTLVNKLSTAI